MKLVSVAAAAVVGGLLLAGCGGSGSGSSAASSSSSAVASGTKLDREISSAEPSSSVSSPGSSPLAGVGGGPQQPSVVPTVDDISDADYQKAYEISRDVLEIYGSGVPPQPWHRRLDPYVSADFRERLKNVRPEYVRFSVTGEARTEEDPTVNFTNPYWTLVVIPTDAVEGAYAVRLRRDGETNLQWKVDDILPYKTISSVE